jgi:hypothetical protein
MEPTVLLQNLLKFITTAVLLKDIKTSLTDFFTGRGNHNHKFEK